MTPPYSSNVSLNSTHRPDAPAGGDEVIDLSTTRHVLKAAVELINQLHGQDLDETAALTDQSKGAARRERAQRSQDLQLLAGRLELAAQLVRVEYLSLIHISEPTRR